MKNDKTFEKYISETTIIDYYITENIIILLEDDNFKNNIKENIILLGKINKNGLNIQFQLAPMKMCQLEPYIQKGVIV